MTVPARLETYTTDVEIKVDDSQIYVDVVKFMFNLWADSIVFKIKYRMVCL